MFPNSYKNPFFTLCFTYIQSLFARACVVKCLILLLILIQKMVTRNQMYNFVFMAFNKFLIYFLILLTLSSIVQII